MNYSRKVIHSQQSNLFESLCLAPKQLHSKSYHKFHSTTIPQLVKKSSTLLLSSYNFSIISHHSHTNTSRTDYSFNPLFYSTTTANINTNEHGNVRFVERPRTLVEKIVLCYMVPTDAQIRSGKALDVRPNDIVSISPEHVMTHDNTAAVMDKFRNFFSSESEYKVNRKDQPVFCLDHNIQDKSEQNLQKYKSIESFAETLGVDFHPAGRGIGHQVMCEEGYAWPQTMVVASDSHSNMYGGLGCLGTPVVRTDAAAIWATSKTWWQVPKIANVKLTGQLKEGVTGKDVIITLCGLFNNDQVLNYAVEFTGEGVSNLSIEERMTISNMTTEWGALAGVFPIDEKTISWLENRQSKYETKKITTERLNQLKNNILKSDPEATYDKTLTLDLSKVEQHVSGPNHVKVMTPVHEIEKEQKKIHKAYIVSCVNSRVDDLAEAAAVMKGRKIAEHVELYIAAASSQVEQESKQRGDWEILVSAGAKVLPPGCGPCIGLGAGLLKDGEVGISATNRNFKGRMGSPSAQAYLASPSVVAASAIRGYISSPNSFLNIRANQSVDSLQSVGYESQSQKTDSSQTDDEIPIVDGFPKSLNANLVFCHQNNLNTDGIYPGKYTYKEDISPEVQAQVVMENYDENFSKSLHSLKQSNEKDYVLISGYNFGTGSSREQAATALKHAGLRAIIAGSFSETYKRNATNNGLLTIEVPELVEKLLSLYGTKELSVFTKDQIVIDFEKATINVHFEETNSTEKYSFYPVGLVQQELIVQDGLESWVLNNLKKN